MSFYDRHILPHMINIGCGMEAITEQRKRIVPRATGRVLEIGFGSGLNLAHYDPKHVTAVVGVEPSQELLGFAAPRAASAAFHVEMLNESAEAIPLPSQSFDSVVVILSLCTIPDTAAALSEVRRLLKPGGKFLFSEHGLAPDANIRRWQQRLNPLWGKLMGGCHLNRKVDDVIRAAGFRLEEIDAAYIPDMPLKFASFQYVGIAVPN